MGRHSMLGETTGRHAVPVITTLPERFGSTLQRARICGYVNPVANRPGESVCILPPGHVTGHRFGSPDPDAWIYE